MPGVDGPAPGGVTYLQARSLIHGLVKKVALLVWISLKLHPQKIFPLS